LQNSVKQIGKKKSLECAEFEICAQRNVTNGMGFKRKDKKYYVCMG
jgi:hypothetical protein